MLQTLLLGLIQGATEFLPVSSSGHLWLTEYFLGIPENLNLTIALHVATVLAVILYYYKSIWTLIKHTSLYLVSNLKSKTQNSNAYCKDDAQLTAKLLVTTLITVMTALLIEPYFEFIINKAVVAITLIITGGLILISEKFRPTSTRSLSWPIIIGLGIFQGIAVVPGLSRSGLTIAFLILMGLKRGESARISFLLSIPTILGAGLFMLKDNNWKIPLAPSDLLACIVAFFVALITIHWMTRLIERNWIYFAPYCIGLGFILFWL